MKPKLLDLFCGAGGAAVGYNRADFEVIGVDIKPQKHYPFQFIQTDALRFLAAWGDDYDAIHASPPCQRYMKVRTVPKEKYPDLVAKTRDLLLEKKKPYVIENVVGAPLFGPIMLIGTMFGLGVIRPRLFECNFEVPFLLMPPPHNKQTKMGRPLKEGEYMHVVGNFSGVEDARKAMGIDWMTQKELSQAIPPAYAEFIGKYLMQEVLINKALA